MTVTEPTGPRFDEGRQARWLAALNAPRDAAGLGAFRILFGALLCFSVVRFWAYGWIEQLYIQPAFHFTYVGFEWVRPWPGSGMYVHFAVMALAALSLCIGYASRLSAALFFLTFTYAELIEKASYLNHYYFVSLVTLLLASMPSGASLSVDAWLRARRGQAPELGRTWCYGLLRTQLALLYFFAGFAKLNSDWLLSAEPLGTWLALHADAPLIGPWLASRPAAYLASYIGAAFDLTIPAWLSWPRSRGYAYAVAAVFHLGVWLLFPIGVFSWVMIVSTTLFFDPSWPRRWRRAGAEPSRHSGSPEGTASSNGARLTRGSLIVLGAYLLVQLAAPLRYVLYPGNVNWHEQGFRFAWRVMLVEKAGQVEFRVLTEDGRRFVVYPRDELTPLQYKMMTTQPDMIQEFALHVERRFSAEGHTHVQVYADAWASLNGRARQRLIDPDVDLASTSRSLWPKPWILPLQNSS